MRTVYDKIMENKNLKRNFADTPNGNNKIITDICRER